eukprot:3094140-Pleurochrysis_carterae.AAC.2
MAMHGNARDCLLLALIPGMNCGPLGYRRSGTKSARRYCSKEHADAALDFLNLFKASTAKAHARSSKYADAPTVQ